MRWPAPGSPTRAAGPRFTVAWFGWRESETNENLTAMGAAGRLDRAADRRFDRRFNHPGSGVHGLQEQESQSAGGRYRISAHGIGREHGRSQGRYAVGGRPLRRGSGLLAVERQAVHGGAASPLRLGSERRQTGTEADGAPGGHRKTEGHFALGHGQRQRASA